MKNSNGTTIKRAPVVVIMGHIDHGKSTLLSFIRKSNEPLNEAGGITQHISAYEIEHKISDGTLEKITFLDTPGHEAFSGHRTRGANIADVAVLVVSAEDGVKTQTLEALKSIQDSKTNFIVAITKIDKPAASVDRTKQSLAEHNILVEGYGGDIPMVPVSGKTGEGIPELLDMILLVASLEDLKGNPHILAEGVILESGLDSKKGVGATCIIKNGKIETGMFVASYGTFSPVRVMEDWTGKTIRQATFSSPVKIIGWNSLPKVGEIFRTFENKKEAEAFAEEMQNRDTRYEIPQVAELSSLQGKRDTIENEQDIKYFQIILKTDTGGSLEAVTNHIKKLSNERISPKIIHSGIGTISENDVRIASSGTKALIVGFNVKVDPQAKTLAERDAVEIVNFDIIYKLSEWLEQKLIDERPSIEVEELTGESKVLKTFSKIKDKQIIGCRMENGMIAQNELVKIIRRESEIGTGKVRELQNQKLKVSEVAEGKEFGAMVEAKIEIAPGDKLRAVKLVKK